MTQMLDSLPQIRRALAGLIVVVALLPLGVVHAKDWKPGDPGMCPGTWDSKHNKCKRPYLCEPTRCFACSAGQGNKCIECSVVQGKPGCKGSDEPVKLPSASSANAPSTPADETGGTGRFKPVTGLGVHHTNQ